LWDGIEGPRTRITFWFVRGSGSTAFRSSQVWLADKEDAMCMRQGLGSSRVELHFGVLVDVSHVANNEKKCLWTFGFNLVFSMM
jgi:hypothetical protein